ncbi:MAG: hypothetical protein MJ138_07865 [Kiritimatiellae bacterium]|nr:hypothetical protein [Kiritimatiellia bacterium]
MNKSWAAQTQSAETLRYDVNGYVDGGVPINAIETETPYTFTTDGVRLNWTGGDPIASNTSDPNDLNYKVEGPLTFLCIGTYKSSGRIYSARIWRNGVLIHDLRPIADKFGENARLHDFCDNPCDLAHYGVFSVNPSARISGELPHGYRLLPYLRSTGREFIDTGFRPTGTTTVAARFFLHPSTDYQAPFGARTGGERQFFAGCCTVGCAVTSVNRWEFCFVRYNGQGSDDGSGSQPKRPFARGAHEFRFADNTWILDGISFMTFNPESFETDCPAYVFACNNQNSAAYLARMDFHSLRFADSATGKIERDFVPMQRIADGALGLYDLARSQAGNDAKDRNFFVNASGAGGFVPPLPKGYEQLSYLRSTGTQYVKTGVCPDGDTRVDVRCDIRKIAGDFFFPFGTRNSENSQALLALACGSTRWETRYADASDNGLQSVVAPPTVGPHYFCLNYFGGSVDKGPTRLYVVDVGKPLEQAKPTEFPADVPLAATDDLYVFTLNTAGTADERIWPMDVSSVLVWQRDPATGEYTPSHDFVPCRRVKDGELGLYDVLSADPKTAFRTNAGTGVFGAGEVVCEALKKKSGFAVLLK